jgi:hypothetical protein
MSGNLASVGVYVAAYHNCVACVQVIVPKRTALLLDRIMVALQKAVEDEKGRRNLAPATVESKVCNCVEHR